MVVCSGCQKSCKNSQGLQKHRNTCPGARGVAKSLLRRHKGLHNSGSDGLQVRSCQNRSKEPEHAEDILQPEMPQDQPMDVQPDQASAPLYEALPPTRSGRARKFPRHYTDFLPDMRANAARVPHMPIPAPVPIQKPQKLSPEPQDNGPVSPMQEGNVDNSRQWIDTVPNEFGIYHSYQSFPGTKNHPSAEANDDLENICDSAGIAGSTEQCRWWAGWGSSLTDTLGNNVFAPFLNATVFRLMNWFYTGSNLKTTAELDRLVNDVLLADDFAVSDLNNFSATREMKRMDQAVDGGGEAPRVHHHPAFPCNIGWKEASVSLPLNCEGVHHEHEDKAPILEVPGVYYRNLVDVIKSAFTDVSAKRFHFKPFRLFWQPSPTSTPQRLHGELYNSDAFLEEHYKISTQPPEPGPPLEVAIAAIMLWSDSTHLANFGTASLWPIYAFFGNQSKYDRAKPTKFAAHHIAYMPSLPSTIQDIYMKAFDGEPASTSTLTHLKRELIQCIWELMLDEKFMEAYKHGIVICCADGVTRRLFPRFFTYSADYPEKVLLATIRYLAMCPCPRCHVKKSDIGALGTTIDNQRRKHTRVDDKRQQDKVEITRRWIYNDGKGVSSKPVNDMLQAESLVPTRSAFGKRLYKYGVNFFSMFVPDLLHEFELGVWKAVFTHLLRVLDASGGDSVQELNWRYRRVPTFGRDTIRKFCNNASSMSKLAAHDFEDLLQCSIPVFEDLLPEPHNRIVLDLLFVLCTWHAYAKLRLHSSTTLTALKDTTRTLGNCLRTWVNKTCSAFDTKELPWETAARNRRRQAAKTDKPQQPTSSKLRKLFNMCTYKLHALGDYVDAISRYGTSDSYSTQIGELEHRRVKRFYVRTNKNFTFTRQITRQQQRERMLREIRGSIESSKSSFEAHTAAPLPKMAPEVHYEMSQTTRQNKNLFQWVYENGNDDAMKNFIPSLKDHLLARLLGHAYHGDETTYSDTDRDTVQIVNDIIHQHKVLRVNYTSYDMRRCQDSINPRTHPDIMTLAHEDEDESNAHPYWYARVIGIFHVNVVHKGQLSRSPYAQRMDFIWVRWFGREIGYKAGWAARRLHRVGFLDASGDGAFEFVDPAEVVRGVHIIPAFAQGTTTGCLGPSIARKYYSEHPNDEDWQFYYINMFVDRDMFMRFCGGGVGHKSIHSLTQVFAHDQEDAAADKHPDVDWHDIQNSDSREDDVREYEEEDFGYAVLEEEEDVECPGPNELIDADEQPMELEELAIEGYAEL